MRPLTQGQDGMEEENLGLKHGRKEALLQVGEGSAELEEGRLNGVSREGFVWVVGSANSGLQR